MGQEVINPEVEQQARNLARANREADTQVTSVYWFPKDDEVRLVELTDSVPCSPDGRVHAFHFSASARDGLTYPSAVALIRPDELGRLTLPDGWGQWTDAVEL
jgi:hypothetical protein